MRSGQVSLSNVRIKINKFPEVAKAAVEAADRAVRAIAHALEEEAVNNIQQMNAIDTGALMNSRYVESSHDNGRVAAIANALSYAKRPGAKSGKPHGSLDLAYPSAQRRKPGEAKFAFAVGYAVFVNDGTNVMGARPFMDEAVAAIRLEARQIAASAVKEVL